ncbi:MAG: hypothetical protein FJ125_01675, partial [Deltaproteobacteria bacterium]|nr:hypothetical protein [Deltaproteobacteria bacterium]
MIDRTTTPIMEPEPGVLEATRRCALQLALLEDMPPAACGEYVVTPPWFVASLCQSIGLWPWGQRILDAGAGTG